MDRASAHSRTGASVEYATAHLDDAGQIVVAPDLAKPAPSAPAAAPSPAPPAAPSPTPAAPSTTPPAPPASSDAVRASMQGNKGKNTKPELLLRQRLRQAGLSGYRIHWKAPGKPDVAWPGKKVAVMVHGCFWHRHEGCKYASTPRSHVEYWTFKFDRNVQRDAENLVALQETGWTVHVVWECELKRDTIDATMAALLPQLSQELGKPLAP